MESEFASASQRQARARAKNLELAKKRQEKERDEARVVEDAERSRQAAKRERDMHEALQRAREQEELSSTGGVRVVRVLQAVPDHALETDRVTLPPSLLAALTEQDALSSARGPMTFELALLDDDDDQVVSMTHAGVREFTAAEGSIGLPVKTALSLSKGRRLDASSRVRVKYVVLDRHARVRASVQPLGEGFHEGATAVVNIDLKSVMERALTSCTVLSQGDLVPLRHDGRTYTLRVQSLDPEPQCLLLDTELEIDLLPAESVTLAQQAKEQLARQLAERDVRAQQRLQRLAPEPPAASAAVAIRARLPSGAQATRRFQRAGPLELVFEWIAALAKTDPGELELVLPMLPGQAPRTLTFAQASESLTSLGLVARTESLHVRHVPLPAEASAPPRLDTPADSPWAVARVKAESSLDQHLRDLGAQSTLMEQDQDRTSSVDMFKLLVQCGAEPNLAARACQNHLGALRTLKALGLVGETTTNGASVVGLLEKFNGGVTRVADALLAPSPFPVQPDGELQHSLPDAHPEELQRFPLPAPPPPPPPPPTRDWSNEIESLQEMGMDVASQRELVVHLLEQHGGSIERVVEKLLGLA
jgi:hypothetical protein